MLRKLTKNFILKEGLRGVDPLASLQALTDIITSVRVTNKRGKGHVHRKMQTLAMSAAQLSSCAGHFYGLRKETLIL